MLRPLCCVVVWLVCGVSAFAQFTPFNPYATNVEDSVAVTPDGKINWPTFYKSVDMKNKFQVLFAMGSCRGTRKDIVDKLVANKFNINQLAESTITGKVVQVRGGTIVVASPTGEVTGVVTHPAGVSRVKVTGEIPVAGLLRGLPIRFVAKVDERGHGLERLDGFEVFAPPTDFRWKGVEAGHLQSIAGAVVNFHHSRLQINVEPGKLHRLSLLLTDDCRIMVNSGDMRLIYPGDDITVTGHIYSGDGIATNRAVFANKIEVTKIYQHPAVADRAQAASGG